jgi:hypothetical protein
LWNQAGEILAQVTFTNETDDGWQQADFSTPVAVTAGQPISPLIIILQGFIQLLQISLQMNTLQVLFQHGHYRAAKMNLQP